MRTTFTLAFRNLAFNRLRSLAAAAGIAMGLAIVAMVAVVDESTVAAGPSLERETVDPIGEVPTASSGRCEALKWLAGRQASFPRRKSRSGAEDRAAAGDPAAGADYRIMRNLVRFTSLLAFGIGTLIVFHTLTVTLEERRRELALLRAAGATRPQVASILGIEALLLTAAGVLAGLAAGVVLGGLLVRLGITTTGRGSAARVVVPWLRLGILGVLGSAAALAALWPVLRRIRRLTGAEAARPAPLEWESAPPSRGAHLPWMIPLALAGAVLVLTPRLERVVTPAPLLLAEAALLSGAMALAVLFAPPLLRALVGAAAPLIARVPGGSPLLTRRHLASAAPLGGLGICGVMLVAGAVLSLHLVVHSLKEEVRAWGRRAAEGLAFAEGGADVPLAGAFHLFQDASGPFPVRSLHGEGPPPAGWTLPGRGEAVVSTVLARERSLAAGGSLSLDGRFGPETFRVSAVEDRGGYFPSIGTYRANKTYALVHPEDFAENFADRSEWICRRVLPEPPARASPFGRRRDARWILGRNLVSHRVLLTDRDFLIFDLIFALCAGLAGLGIFNVLLLAAMRRRRAAAILRSLGMGAGELGRLLLLEGAALGLLGGILGLALGLPLAWLAVRLLSELSVFPLAFSAPPALLLWVPLASVAVSVAASVQPAISLARTRLGTALRYE